MPSPEWAHFVDGFDHYPVAWTARKYGRVLGPDAAHPLAALSRVPGPFAGEALRVTGGGTSLHSQFFVVEWMHGGFSAHVRVGSAGWGAAGYVALLRPMWWNGIPGSANAPYPHHELRVYPDGHLAVHWIAVGSLTAETSWVFPPVPGAVSAAGAFPLDAWHHLEYHTHPFHSTIVAERGYVDVRVDEAPVLSVAGVRTADQELRDTAYFAFGNFGPAGNGAAVDFDDVCDRRVQSTDHTDRPTWWGRHTVHTALPVGPGSRPVGFEVGHTLNGPAPRWQALVDLPAAPPAPPAPPLPPEPLPPDPADWDGHSLVKEFGPSPVDLFAMPALPAFDDAAGAVAITWTLARSLGPTEEASTSTGIITVHRYRPEAAPPAQHAVAQYAQSPVGVFGFGNAERERALLGQTLNATFGAPWEAGFGDDRFPEEGGVPATTTDAYEATQLAVELWYRPAGPPPTGGGGQRWSAGWVD